MSMASAKLSPQDRKDLDKYTKYLVYKCAQIIVQSRNGEKMNTPSKLVSSGADWFNLSIRDDGDIQSEIKNVYGSGNLLDGQKVCFEISVKTSEGEETALETWYMETNEHIDPTSRILCSVYTRMGALLRSLLIATRSVPAYRVSREQAPDRYVMCYRIYLGMPKLKNLGENYIKHTVGLVPSPVGTIALYVAYREKKDFSVTHHLADALAKDFRDNYYHSESIPHSKSDHFCARIEPTAEKQNPRDFRRRSAADILLTDNIGTCKTRIGEQGKQSADVPVEKESDEVDSQSAKGKVNSSPCKAKLSNEPKNANSASKVIEANRETSIEDDCHQENEDTSTKQQPAQSVASNSNISDHNSPSTTSAPDDFVVLDMKKDDSKDEELGKFYQDCKVAPPLSMFQQSTDLREMLNSITDQLAQFEANAKEFDEFVNSITEDVN